MLGWQVPDPIGIVAFVLHLAGLALLVTGPQPWRATRWAWFWLLLLPPVGSIAFLLLSGPTAGLPAPKVRPGRRSAAAASPDPSLVHASSSFAVSRNDGSAPYDVKKRQVGAVPREETTGQAG